MTLENTQTETAAQEIIAASTQLIRSIDGMPLVLLPDGFKVEDLERMLPAPTRKKGVTILNDVESFIAVVNDQKGDNTRLFSTINPPSFTAVFNYTAAAPGWGDHVAKYNAPLAPEWITWTGQDKRAVGQVELAQFIEDNLVDVIAIEPIPESRHPGSPDGATLLSVCRSLEAKKKVDFQSSVRLADGSTEFTYNEDVQGSAQKGTLLVPEQFTIAVPVFENGDKWRVDVRLRYRLADGGRLTMWIELIRPHKVIEAAVTEMRVKIAQATELAILNGKP